MWFAGTMLLWGRSGTSCGKLVSALGWNWKQPLRLSTPLSLPAILLRKAWPSTLLSANQVERRRSGLTWTTCAQSSSEETLTRKEAGAYHLTPSVSASVFFYYNKVRFENCGPIAEKGAEKLYKQRRDVLHPVVSTPMFSEHRAQRQRQRQGRFLCCRNISLVTGTWLWCLLILNSVNSWSQQQNLMLTEVLQLDKPPPKKKWRRFLSILSVVTCVKLYEIYILGWYLPLVKCSGMSRAYGKVGSIGVNSQSSSVDIYQSSMPVVASNCVWQVESDL